MRIPQLHSPAGETTPEPQAPTQQPFERTDFKQGTSQPSVTVKATSLPPDPGTELRAWVTLTIATAGFVMSVLNWWRGRDKWDAIVSVAIVGAQDGEHIFRVSITNSGTKTFSIHQANYLYEGIIHPNVLTALEKVETRRIPFFLLGLDEPVNLSANESTTRDFKVKIGSGEYPSEAEIIIHNNKRFKGKVTRREDHNTMIQFVTIVLKRALFTGPYWVEKGNKNKENNNDELAIYVGSRSKKVKDLTIEIHTIRTSRPIAQLHDVDVYDEEERKWQMKAMQDIARALPEIFQVRGGQENEDDPHDSTFLEFNTSLADLFNDITKMHELRQRYSVPILPPLKRANWFQRQWFLHGHHVRLLPYHLRNHTIGRVQGAISKRKGRKAMEQQREAERLRLQATRTTSAPIEDIVDDHQTP